MSTLGLCEVEARASGGGQGHPPLRQAVDGAEHLSLTSPGQTPGWSSSRYTECRRRVERAAHRHSANHWGKRCDWDKTCGRAAPVVGSQTPSLRDTGRLLPVQHRQPLGSTPCAGHCLQRRAPAPSRGRPDFEWHLVQQSQPSQGPSPRVSGPLVCFFKKLTYIWLGKSRGTEEGSGSPGDGTHTTVASPRLTVGPGAPPPRAGRRPASPGQDPALCSRR